MNEQTSGQLRQLLQAVGAIIATLGFMTTGQVDLWISIIMQIAGPAAMVGGVIWSYFVNTPTALVASVVTMAADPASPVKGVVVDNTMEGRALKQDIPSMGIATAGSHDAKIIANSGATP